MFCLLAKNDLAFASDDGSTFQEIRLRLESDPRPFPPEIAEPKPNLRNVSTAVKFCKKSSRGGRYSVADRKIEAGEVIFVDKPMVSFLAGTRWASNCGHCCRPLCYTLVPSPVDANVIFCGIRCCVDAMTSYHVLESRFNLRWSIELKTGRSNSPPPNPY